ncbi:hypothetical protein Unana1_06729 [Umbelopsis nana]
MATSVAISKLEIAASAAITQLLQVRDIFTSTVLPRLNKRSKITYVAAAIFPKARAIDQLDSRALVRRFFGKTNLSLANGHEWKRRRKIANPAFRRSLPVKLFSRLTSQIFEQIDKANGDPILVPAMMQRLTIDAIALAGFGFELNAINTPNGEWVDAYNDVANHLLEFPYLFLPVLEAKFFRFFLNRCAKHDKLTRLNILFEDIIRHKKESLLKEGSDVEDNEKDLLTLLIEAGRGENDDSEPLTNQELRDELVVFFFAGHDTTANTLAATLYYLAVNPTIRIASPTITLIQRQAAEDTELAGVVIPKRTVATVDIASLHHNPNLWENPEVFDPERFAEGGEHDSKSSPYSYLAFGGGTRQCIGMNFSIAEQRVVLSGLLRKYDVSLPENSIHKDGLQFNSHLILLSSKDLKLKFTRRY